MLDSSNQGYGHISQPLNILSLETRLSVMSWSDQINFVGHGSAPLDLEMIN